MALLSFGKSDIGKVRKNNQDSIFLDESKNLFIVADGMGGHKGGEVASALAAQKIPEFLAEEDLSNPSTALINATKKANLAIFQQSKENEDLKGMGTTVTQLYFQGPLAYLANLGDSRTYLINKKSLFQLTRDHSLVQEKLNIGLYTREQAQKDPNKNVLSKTCGFMENIEIDVFTYKVKKNDLFLLCSDGLCGYVSEGDIIHIINEHIPNLDAATEEDLKRTVEKLITQANDNGGKDNVSVIMVLAK